MLHTLQHLLLEAEEVQLSCLICWVQQNQQDGCTMQAEYKRCSLIVAVARQGSWMQGMKQRSNYAAEKDDRIKFFKMVAC